MAVDLLYLAVVFLAIALLSYLVGARGFAWFTADLAKFIIWVFLILAVIAFVFRLLF